MLIPYKKTILNNKVLKKKESTLEFYEEISTGPSCV